MFHKFTSKTHKRERCQRLRFWYSTIFAFKIQRESFELRSFKVWKPTVFTGKVRFSKCSNFFSVTCFLTAPFASERTRYYRKINFCSFINFFVDIFSWPSQLFQNWFSKGYIHTSRTFYHGNTLLYQFSFSTPQNHVDS